MRNVFKALQNTLTRAWEWLHGSRHAGHVMLLLGIGVVFLAMSAGYHEPFMRHGPSDINELPKGWQQLSDPVVWMLSVPLYLAAYLRLIVMVGGVVCHLYLLRAWPNPRRMVLPLGIYCGVVAVWILLKIFFSHWEATQVNWSGEAVPTEAYILEGILAVLLLALPPCLLAYVSRVQMMERYVLRTLVSPLVFCFIAFLALWIMMDLLDNLQDFQKNKISFGQVLLFYVRLTPFIYITIAPVALLLAIIYTFGRLSKSNELVAMLSAGRSLYQILRPAFVIGIVCSILGLGANFRLAPAAEGDKDALLGDVKERLRQNVRILGLMHRNEEQRRTWFVGVVPGEFRDGRLRRLEIRQEDEHGNPVKAWFARSAFWWQHEKVWSLYNGIEVNYLAGGVVSMQLFDYDGLGYSRKDMEGWQETPWSLMSGSLVPDYMGVPDLTAYLRAGADFTEERLAPYRTHWHYRFARPWHCFVVVLFAAPLAVVFSRRGLVGGITGSVLLFFALLFMDSMFLNLGRSQQMGAAWSVWSPHFSLGSTGLFLFWMRSRNREMPRLIPRLRWPTRPPELVESQS